MTQKQFILDAYNGRSSYEELIVGLENCYVTSRKQAVSNIRRILTLEQRNEMKGRSHQPDGYGDMDLHDDQMRYEAGLDENHQPTEEPLEFTGALGIDSKYVVLDATGIYHTFLDPNGKGRVHAAIPRGDIELAFEMYSNWEETGKAATINEVCTKLGWTRPWFAELRKEMGLTHDVAPFTDDQLEEMSTNEQIKSLRMMERNKLQVENDRSKLKELQEAADKWRDFSFKTIDPIRSFVETNPVPKVVYIRPQEPYVSGVSAKTVVFAPQDLHIGKANWDGGGSVQESCDTLLRTTRALVGKVHEYLQGAMPDVILLLGSDWWNVDNFQGQTSSGTPQDNTELPEVALRVGLDLQIKVIEILRELGPVQVFMVPGNHDYYTCHAAHWGVAQSYKDTEDVEVSPVVQNFQYHQFGENMFGFHHGHGLGGSRKSKPGAYLQKMALVEKQMWANTSWRYQFGGHFHGMDMFDDGITYIQTRSLSFDDRWHELKGYTMRDRGQDCFVFDEKRGLDAMFTELVKD